MTFFRPIIEVIKRLFLLVRAVLRYVFGSISWQAPAWLKYVGSTCNSAGTWVIAWVRNNRRLAWRASIVFIVFAGMVTGGVAWYRHLPQPVEVEFRGKIPSLTKIEEKLNPDPLLVIFSSSVAALDKVGKSVSSGIEMYPNLEGTWKWDDDKQLSFTPKADWPVGEVFTVTLHKKGFIAEHVRLKEYEFKFKTEPFAASISNAEFYQDPVDPNLKKVVATVTFSHPVDVADFEKRVMLRLKDQKEGILGLGGERFKSRVTYDKLKGNAYIHSDPIAIPLKDTSMTIVVDAGARAAQGGPGLSKKIEREVQVPGLFSFLRVNSATLSLANNARYEPEQVLVFDLTTGVASKDIQQNIQAYVLPVYHPETKEEERKRPYYWSDVTKIGPEILKLSTLVKLEPIEADRDYPTLHSFKYQADVERFLYIQVNKGIKSFGGYVLGKLFDTIARVPPFPKELKILGHGALLSMSGEKKVSVYARDVEAIQFEVRRVLPGQVQHLVTQTGGDLRQPDFRSYSFNQDNITDRFIELRELPKVVPGKPQYQAFDLSQYLQGGEGRRGLFLIKVEGYDLANKRTTGGSDHRLVLVTDLGLLVKDALDESHDVFVQSIHQGDPVPGATVQVLGRNGLPVLTATTDQEGHVRFPTLKNFKREQAPTLYLVRNGADMSLLPFEKSERQLDMSRFDVGGVANAEKPDRLTAYLFSDRGIYRPGDEIRIGMIVKPNDWRRNVENVPLEVVVTDARGLTVKKEKLKLSAVGFDEVRHTTQETSPTGTYTVNLYVVKDRDERGLLGAVPVRVQEFLPDRMKISARLSAESVEGWVLPKDLKGRVTLQNLFGTPATARQVRAGLNLSPTLPAFSRFKDYTFYDPLRAKDGFNENLPDGRTGDDGEAEFDLNLQRFAPATYRLRFMAQGYEAEGGRSVAAEAAVTVSPLAYLIGYKADGDLHYVGKDSQRSVDVIAINPEVQKVAIDGLKLQVIERRYVSVLTKQSNNTYKYESVKREILMEEKALTIPAAGFPYELPTAQPGTFAVVIRDKSGTELNRVEYAVAGQGNLSRSLEKNAELQLLLKKPDYAPGEEIEMQIKAPYTGAGLITIERDKVYQHRWFKANTTSTTQKIRLPANFEGNGYVSVAFIRDVNSDEIFMSPLSYGVAPFSVSRERRTAKITVMTPDLAKPSEPFRIRYKTDRPTRIVLFAVDEGILQVAGYKTPDPLGHFFQKRALQVKTWQILDLILPEFKRFLTMSAPGGDAEGALGKNLNPFKRKREKPVAFWSGILDADAKEREVVYQVPDYFNGTLRVMAVAVADESVGVVQKRAQVRGDFVISPNVPTFAAPGDEFEVSVSVANNVLGSGKTPEVTLNLTTSSHLEVVGQGRVAMKIGELREATASFRLRAKPVLGSATMTFAAAMGAKSGKYTIDLSVRPPMPYMTTVSAGHFKDGKVETPVTRTMYPEFRTLQAGISHLPLGLAHGLIRYLEKFPYGCTEQLVSQAFPAVILRSRPEFGYAPESAEKILTGIVGTLRARQNGEGAFGLWAANTHVSEFSSVYALHFLIEAKERGFAVPPEMLEHGSAYLTQLASTEGDSIGDERVRAYAVYVLTRSGVTTSNYVTALQERLEKKFAKTWKQDLAGIYLAATYQLLKQERPARNILGVAKLGDAQASDYAHYYDGLIRDAQFLYILARHFPDRLGRLSGDELNALIEPIRRGSFNSLSSAYTILALDAYAKAAGNPKIGKLAIREILAKGQPRELTLPEGLFPQVSFSGQASNVQFASSGDFPAFYHMTQAGFDTKLPSQVIKNKLEVLREYTDSSGKVVSKLKVGDEVDVHVKIRGLDAKRFAHIVIVDLLPGGFEVVIEAPKSAAESQTPPENPDVESGDAPPEPERDTRLGTGIAVAAQTSAYAQSSWQPEYRDTREDRVVLYGAIGADVQEYVYRIKATNAGEYAVPPTFGESMYDRSVQARSLGGKITVEKK